MNVQWMRGRLVGNIHPDGRIELEVTNLEPQITRRPRSIEESGADPSMVHKIQNRIPGPIDTLGFIGGAVAWTVKFSRLAILPPALMAKLEQKYGAWDDLAYIAMVRTTGANAIWNCAEPAGGMAESADLDFEQLDEGLELGLYKEDDGWARFLLPSDLHDEFQSRLDDKQEMWWNVAQPGLLRIMNVRTEFSDTGKDTRNGVPGIWAAGPVGDISFTRIANINLVEDDWQMLDCEARPGNPEKGELEWMPLHRKVVAICNRPGKAPIMFEFGPNGKLAEGGLHVILDGENRQHAISHLSTAVLQALGWMS